MTNEKYGVGVEKEGKEYIRRMTEYLLLDLKREMWQCYVCGRDLMAARKNYKEGLLVRERDPREIHNPMLDAEKFPYSFSPKPEVCRIIEFYCPDCLTLVDTEYLPPGHPLTYDIEPDIDSLKKRYLKEQDKE